VIALSIVSGGADSDAHRRSERNLRSSAATTFDRIVDFSRR
jgi:hypothetical protein